MTERADRAPVESARRPVLLPMSAGRGVDPRARVVVVTGPVSLAEAPCSGVEVLVPVSEEVAS